MEGFSLNVLRYMKPPWRRVDNDQQTRPPYQYVTCDVLLCPIILSFVSIVSKRERAFLPSKSLTNARRGGKEMEERTESASYS